MAKGVAWTFNQSNFIVLMFRRQLKGKETYSLWPYVELLCLLSLLVIIFIF